MQHSLDNNPQDFKKLLDITSEMVIDQFNKIESKKAYHFYDQQEVESWFDEPLPREGMNENALLAMVKEKVLNTATNNLGPYMYAYVMTGGTQLSILAEKLSATINQNVGKWHLAPAINEIEKRVIQWGGEMAGFGSNAAGVLVSGGSAANLAGLAIARNLFFEKHDVRKKGLFGMKPFTVYASKEVHGCIDKSMEELGIGSEHLRKIAVNEDFSIHLQSLHSSIENDIKNGFTPFCLVGNAGTVNTGAIDDLTSLAEIAQKYNMWYHVDGAYGGLLGSLPSISKHYRGIELADSLAVDFHKWMYQTFEGGCVLVRNWDTLKRAYFKKASYLDAKNEAEGRINFNEHYFALSRNDKALKIWMSLKGYGLTKIQEMMQKDIDLAHYLGQLVKDHPDFELKSTSHLAITCFRYNKDLESEASIDTFNRRLINALEKDGRIFITGTQLNGQFVIRACLINHRMHTGTIDYMFNVIQELALQLKNKF